MQVLNQLIAIPSESRHETAIVEFIVGWLQQRDVHAFIQDENAVGFIRGKDSSRALILNGHVDTVPAGDTDAWTYGPYTPTEVDGILYGLGVSDMKAGVAGILMLAEQYATEQPPCDIWFSLVVGEEIDGKGTASFLEWFDHQGHIEKYASLQAIIAEPTNCEYVGIGHRGNYFINLTIDSPRQSSQSVYDITRRLCDDIKKLESLWKRQYTHSMLGEPTIGLTAIHIGTDENNQSNASGKLTLDIRTTPDLHNKLKKELDSFLIQENYLSVKPHIASSSPVGWCADNTLIREIFYENFPNLKQQAMTGSTDLCFFSERNIPCVIFGPGQRDSMHSINESFELEKLHEFHRTITRLIKYYGDSNGKDRPRDHIEISAVEDRIASFNESKETIYELSRNSPITNAHTIAIEIHGDTGHGSRPADIDRHAIYESFHAIEAIKDYSNKLGLPEKAISIQLLSTGSTNSANQFPGVCKSILNIMTDDEDTFKKIRTFSQKIVEKYTSKKS